MPTQDFPCLTTKRLTLREIGLGDRDALLAIYSNIETMRWYGVEPIVDQEQIEILVATYADWRKTAVGIRWGIELNGVLIGTAGFFRWNKSWHNCMVGYELAQQFHGKGYMEEALRTIIEYGFSHMFLHRIHAEISPHNIASIALIKRLDFYFEGVHREMGCWDGGWHDLHFYSILEQNWNKD